MKREFPRRLFIRFQSFTLQSLLGELRSLQATRQGKKFVIFLIEINKQCRRRFERNGYINGIGCSDTVMGVYVSLN